MCHFVSKHIVKVNLQRCGDAFFDILISKNVKGAKELRPSLCLNTFRNFNRSFDERQMSHAETMNN